MTEKEFKEKIIDAAEKAIHELIAVAKEPILNNSETDLSADKLKNAAATKKLAIMDAFDILKRIQEERAMIETPEAKVSASVDNKKGFAERFSK